MFTRERPPLRPNPSRTSVELPAGRARPIGFHGIGHSLRRSPSRRNLARDHAGMLGHANVGITLDLYTHSCPDARGSHRENRRLVIS